MKTGAVAALLCALVALALLVPSIASAASTDQAVAYQLDPAHDGYQTGSVITTPLSQEWSVSLSGSISYPLIVNGVVYVTAAGSGGGTTLYALEQANGSTLWSHSLGGTYAWSGLAYDAGQVFTVNTNGSLTAFNASTGAIDWSTSLPGQTMFESPPTAVNGFVYTSGAGSGGTVYAVAEATGQVAWTQPVENGDHSSPAVDANGVYVTYDCDQDYAFDPLLGTPLWHHSTACEGGGGDTPVLANGDVFGRDSTSGNVVLAAANGTDQGSFSAAAAPAVGGGEAYMVSGGSLSAVNGSGLGTTDWTFSGDGKLDSAPLVVGNLVFEGSSGGNLYALDASTGTSDWSATLVSGVPAPDERDVSQPLTGLGAGEGTLVVPTGSTLTAYAGANVGSGTPTNVLAPSVTGTPVVGQPVGADVGDWTALPTGYSYQWKDCDSGGTCSDISGATAESYTPTSSQLETTLEVSVAATNSSGTASAIVSGQSTPVTSVPVNTAAPTISGTATDGQELSASTGSWTPSPTGYVYQWLRCQSGTCTPVSGAKSSTYTVGAGDIGSQIEVQVTAVNSVGATTATSQPTSTVPPVATTISLSASANPVTVGSPLTFTATISPSVDGGTVTFSQDGQTVSWCDAMPVSLSASTVTCGGTAVSAGSDDISVSYSGDSDFTASSASLTENIVNAPSTSSLAVVITGMPSSTAETPTFYYRESGDVTSTTCTVDGVHVACDSTHAVLSGLSPGTHIFWVEVYGADGNAHASATWTVVAPSRLPAPSLRAQRTKRWLLLSWKPLQGARSYVLTVTVGQRTRKYTLSASARSFKLKLGRGQRASVKLRAMAGDGQSGYAAAAAVS